MIASITHRWLPSALLFTLALVFAAAGCSKGPVMVQVRGKVLNKDGSVPKGGIRVVRFEPTQDSTALVRQVASGQIGDDGTYELFSKRPGDGVNIGKYNVTFTFWKGPHEPGSLVLEKYTASATTPYKDILVDHDQDDLNFQVEPLAAGATAGAQSGGPGP